MVSLQKVQHFYKGNTNNTFIQFFRYTFVGGVAFLVDFGTLALLTEVFELHYLFSAGIAFILGLTVNYFLSISWVFNNRSLDNRLLEFVYFSVIGLIGLGFNELFLWILTDLFAIYYLLSKIVTAIIVYFWNFFARKFFLFNRLNNE